MPPPSCFVFFVCSSHARAPIIRDTRSEPLGVLHRGRAGSATSGVVGMLPLRESDSHFPRVCCARCASRKELCVFSCRVCFLAVGQQPPAVLSVPNTRKLDLTSGLDQRHTLAHLCSRFPAMADGAWTVHGAGTWSSASRTPIITRLPPAERADGR